MPTIEEVDDFSDPDDEPLVAPRPPPPQPPKQPSTFVPGVPPGLYLPTGMSPPGSGIKTLDKEVYKSWITLYPIYIDAKRPNTAGMRRVPKSKALPWPIAESMAKACATFGLQVVFEPERTHPRDWENPGRVKVLLTDPATGAFRNPSIKNKRQLLNQLYSLLVYSQPAAPAPTPTNPNPLPPIHLRLPPNSPAVSHGALDSAIKGGGPFAGMMGGMGGGEPEKEEEEEKKEVKQPKLMPKPRKLHIKKKR